MDRLLRMWFKALLGRRATTFDSGTRMWRIRPQFNQISHTGRVMCSGPNLQATPKEALVRLVLRGGVAVQFAWARGRPG